MALGRWPSTDYGTVTLHIVILSSFLVLLVTGLRIACDDPDAMWLAFLDPILPMEHLWYRHLVAGILLMAGMAAYAVYIRRARLGARMRFDSARVISIWRGGKPRISALNVAVAWVLLGSLLVEVVSGIVIFWGGGQDMVVLHRWVTWVCALSAVVHVSLHAAYGGLGQVLRVFRPDRLRMATPTPDLAELLAEQLRQRRFSSSGGGGPQRPRASKERAGSLQAHPFATALAAALIVAGLACGSEYTTRPVLKVVAIPGAEAPTIDGDLSDPAWSKSAMSTVITTQGGDFGGTHQSRVEIRALHDREFAYFAFTWDDPTRSLKHQPLVKDKDGWHVVASRSDLADESAYHEDKFAVLLSPPGLPLIGAAIHLSNFPLAGRPASSSGRGMHYTLDGSILDVWQWRAGGLSGYIENCHFGGPQDSETDREEAGTRYNGGFAVDPGQPRYEVNFVTDGTVGEPSVLPRRLPKDIAATREAMGRISEAPNESESESARWWMTMSESIDYSPGADAAVPSGTVIPGIIVAGGLAARPGDIRGVGRWAAGRWTLELVRRLRTGSPYDVDIGDGALLWVAAFDHSEMRHTRHLRPFQLKLE